MRITVFSPYVLASSPHYETELEIMEDHYQSGDTITHLVCNGKLPACDRNPEHYLLRCIECIGKRRFGKSLINGQIYTKSFCHLTPKNIKEIKSTRKIFSNINDLNKLWFDNFDLGYAVASSIISLLRDPNPDLSVCSNLIQQFIVSSLIVYTSLQNYLDKHDTDRLYIYNGRFVLSRAAVRACESRNQDYYVHDRGHNKEYYAVYKNTLIHDFHNRSLRMKTIWEKGKSDPERDAIAETYFLNNQKGGEKLWYSHIKTQEDGLLPDEWNRNKKNIAVFINSDDEFAAISEEFENPIYDSQLDGIRQIADDIKECCPDVHIYVRMHPHLKDVENTTVTEMFNLKRPNLTIIPPDSLVSTYTLLLSADIVLTFGSTVGLEATFWRKPSVLAGSYYYQDFGATYNASTHEEVLRLLCQDLKPKKKETALIHGYYMSTFGKYFGKQFKFYQPETFIKGRYKGKHLLSEPPLRYRLLSIVLISARKIRNFSKTFNAHYRRTRVKGGLKLIYAVLIKYIPNLYSSGFLKNKSKCCPLCQWQGKRFLPHISDDHVVFQAYCPACSSYGRHRAQKLLYEEIFGHGHQNVKVLYCSPKKGRLLTYLKSQHHFELITDEHGRNPRNPKYTLNLTRIPFNKETFDIIICEDSLGRTQHKRKALKELYRILKKEGVCILVVPEKNKITKSWAETHTTIPQNTSTGDDEKELADIIPKGFKIEKISFPIEIKDRISFVDASIYKCQKT